jgi:cell division protein FtsB
MSLTEIVGATSVVTLCAVLFVAASGAQEPAAEVARLEALEAELAGLEQQIILLEDTKAIKRLQRAYGYYVDKKLSREIGALFADNPTTTAELGGSGVYVGKARIAEYYDRIIGGEGLEPGELFNHMILQGVVHADDGRTARAAGARLSDGQHGENAWGRRPVRKRVRQRKRRLEVQQGALVPDLLGTLLARLAQGIATARSAARRLSARSAALGGLSVLSVGVPAAYHYRNPCRVVASRGCAMPLNSCTKLLAAAVAVAALHARRRWRKTT